ncbi:methyl-accepting chemotaxis protein [Thalassobaculum litoreum]|uniref:Methyl-accepting chemotaxis protein n=1 Tax=Thalassobaculum litoreum DSM 18839 TaxID=1123362 RepID=A0A8G2BHS7_9PROT|nr:methyl-accepting chemotaxis protein [Thalassobaculum litoreum]SDF66544.1 methyl-accepting chemotaxis protein [Thalassobaculum litoreum DSM 18839]
MSVAEANESLSTEDLIDAMLAGNRDLVAQRGGEIGQKILRLAGSDTEAEGRLERWVDMSIAASDGVRKTSEMMSSLREVDNRSQSIASAVEELTVTVQTISHTTQSATDEATEATSVSDSGRVAAGQAVDAMESVFEVVQSAVQKVDALAEASVAIGDIVSTIESIAKQTNLLALNATIEAARAGDAGKGFAVVASEVKTLANQTASATIDIRERISGIRSDMEEIVGVMRSGAERVEEGRGTIQTVGQEMENLAERIGSVTRSMGEVSQILGEQQTATEEISEGVTVIADMSARNVYMIDNTIGLLERTGPTIAQAIDGFVKAGVPNATIHAAKSDHMIWMRRLAQMLVGREVLRADELADHHSCRLGKWYDAQKDPRLTGQPAWKALMAPHQRVHRCGIEAAKAFATGDLDRATHLVGEAADASHEVMRLLNELSDHTKG